MNRQWKKRTFRRCILALALSVAVVAACTGAFAEETPIAPELSDRMQAAHAAGANVVGILEAGPDIALYVAQGADNDYYLTHNVSGEASSGGAAFLDARCQLSPRSQHLMIHGHNMRSGVVFGNLDAYEDPAFVKANPLVYWETDDGMEVYVPYAIAKISVDTSEVHYFKMTNWDFDSDTAFLEFADGLRARSVMQLPTSVVPGDALLSLVTCGYDYDNGRLVVALRRLREDETEQQIVELFQGAL